MCLTPTAFSIPGQYYKKLHMIVGWLWFWFAAKRETGKEKNCHKKCPLKSFGWRRRNRLEKEN